MSVAAEALAVLALRLLSATLSGPLAVHKENMKPGVARLRTVLALLMLTAPLAAGAQPAGKVYRVGILGDKASDSNETHLWQIFRAALRERGLN